MAQWSTDTLTHTHGVCHSLYVFYLITTAHWVSKTNPGHEHSRERPSIGFLGSNYKCLYQLKGRKYGKVKVFNKLNYHFRTTTLTYVRTSEKWASHTIHHIFYYFRRVCLQFGFSCYFIVASNIITVHTITRQKQIIVMKNRFDSKLSLQKIFACFRIVCGNMFIILMK